jgi:hypothetical protein
VFEMAAPIQSPAKCEVRCVIRFLKATSALKFLTRYAQEDKFLESIVTEDETWVFFTTPLKFDDDDEVQEEVTTWFKGQAADFYDSGIQKLVLKLNKYLDNAGDFVEK